MNKRMTVVSDPKTGRMEEACNRYGLGRNRMREVAEACGAVIRIGNCYLINYTKVDAYMDSLSGVQ